MPGSFSIGRIGGIRIEINASWIIILVLLTISLATSWFPLTIKGLSTGAYLALGFISAILLFVSVLLHELAHSLVARAKGLPVSSITLFIFGGVSNLEQEPRTAGAEFQLSIVGPIVSLVIGVLAIIASAALPGLRAVDAILGYLGFTNILLGLFNLIPGFPLDGGRVLRSIIWGATGNLRAATRAATIIGQIVAYLFILFGILQVFAGNFFGGIWIGFIGWFLLQAAQSANVQSTLQSVFGGVTVGQVMQPPTVSVEANRTLAQLVYDVLLPSGARTVPVTQLGRFAGIITLADIRHYPREEWDQITVGQAMTPAAQLRAVSPNQSLNDALPLMVGHERDILPVVGPDDQLLGVLSRDAIIHLIEIRRGLNIPHPNRMNQANDQQLPRAS
jgi:Zn-dependent protease/predicted transcriptional regulator